MRRFRAENIPVVSRTDDDVIVIKPAGLASERAYGGDESLVHLMQKRFENHQVRLPHRLDKVTRGVIMVALTDESIRFHNQEIKEGRWGKYYLARIHKRSKRMMDQLVGEHRGYLRREGAKARLVQSGGQPAALKVLAYDKSPLYSHDMHLLIELQTGRYHQIRAMLAELGSPLVGDDLYGGREGSLYLEHAMLRYRNIDTYEEEFAFVREDGDREPVRDSLLDKLSEIAETYEPMW